MPDFIVDPDVLIKQSLSHSGEYVVVVNEKELWVHPEVWSPQYSYSSRFIIQNWDIAPGMSVLDMGTGCGVLAIFAAFSGATRLVATDTIRLPATLQERTLCCII